MFIEYVVSFLRWLGAGRGAVEGRAAAPGAERAQEDRSGRGVPDAGLGVRDSRAGAWGKGESIQPGDPEAPKGTPVLLVKCPCRATWGTDVIPTGSP